MKHRAQLAATAMLAVALLTSAPSYGQIEDFLAADPNVNAREIRHLQQGLEVAQGRAGTPQQYMAAVQDAVRRATQFKLPKELINGMLIQAVSASKITKFAFVAVVGGGLVFTDMNSAQAHIIQTSAETVDPELKNTLPRE